ncbi:MAG: aminotransferase class V-fold PLP-dependent enzyme [Clostridiales Family XIII bacterium]|jgi:cysteine desulfurase|nr:aminotransferase class V-fold PLP-dependent enzyme [Clostridiales Family XIII bacterium]
MFSFRRQIYCDNNATTPVSKAVRKIMNETLAQCYANPSSPYKIAHQAVSALNGARERIARILDAPPETLLFTGCATEANNAIRAIAPLLQTDKRTILYNPLEHPSMLESLFWLQRRGFALLPLKPDAQGRINPQDVESALRVDVGIVVCMAANNEVGTLYDTAGMAAAAHAREALFFCDMVQALGKVPVNLRESGVDYASFSAHKIQGPKGVGLLYVREGAPFAPFMLGGHQEESRRAGTEGLHNIVGFATAVEDVPYLLASAAALRKKRETFIAALRRIAPRCVINSPEDGSCQPGTVSVTFPGTVNAIIMGRLDYYGISVAAGSACNIGGDMPSHVLTGIGLTPEDARATLRITFPHDLSEKDLRYVITAFENALIGQGGKVMALQPSQLTEDVLFAGDTFIIDLRRSLKKDYALKPLPNSHCFLFHSIDEHLHDIPRDRPILVTCETGYDAPIIAYYLRRKGFGRLAFLLWGILGWKLAQPERYARLTRQYSEGVS